MKTKINFKSILIGIIIGIVIMSSVFAAGEIVQYIFTPSTHKLIVDNKEYSNPDIPINMFMFENRNYIPIAVLRDLCLKLGIPFEFDNTTKEIRIDTVTNAVYGKVSSLKEALKLPPEEKQKWLKEHADAEGNIIIDSKKVNIYTGLSEDDLATAMPIKEDKNNNTTKANTSLDGIELKLKYNNKGEYDENGIYYINTTQIETKYSNKFNLENGFWFGRKLQQDNTIIMWMIYKGNTIKPILENIPNFKGREIPLDYYETYMLPLLK